MSRASPQTAASQLGPKGGAVRRFAHPAWLAGAIGAVVLITLAHYWTDESEIALHNVYRRLSYVPIVIAAFSHGFPGGLFTGVVASLAYLPHAFISAHHDPSPAVDKAFEMVLYVVIGGLTGWLVHRRDQARRALERSLLERDTLEEQLVRAGKMSALGQMTAGVAHEIRNPLAAILGSAEALVADLDPANRKYPLGQVLLAEIDRLNRVVSDFVRFARPALPQRRPVDLVALARRVVSLAELEAVKRGVAVEVLADGAREVDADKDQISQVLLNLLLNALQALETRPEGAPPGHVRVRFAPREVGGETFVGVGVEDDGPGIPDDIAEEVFNPYFSTRPDGSGLGLSLSNRIVEAHQGFMEIERDGPTVVWFFLPSRRTSP